MRLSVIVPVFNECHTILEILDRVEAVDVEKEIIVVDDCSTDGTRELLQERAVGRFTLLLHDVNLGKGAALRTGLSEAIGEFVVVQDADLEYDPHDYVKLLSVVDKHDAVVVYGSRLAADRPTMAFRHFVGNRLLTGFTNLLYGSVLTDMETCYKLVKRDLLNDLIIESNRFNVEPELTAKILKQGIAIHEVPISYAGRSFVEGKKISWLDFVSAVWTLAKFRLLA